MKISTSILSIEDNLKEKVLKLDKTSTDYIHLDIVDGKFAPNQTDFMDIKDTLLSISKPLDIHLMVNDLDEYIEKYQSFSPEWISFHIEATKEVEKYIQKIKKFCKVGISINPETKVEALLPYLDKIDVVLVMSVHPGKGGQPFIDVTDKIDDLDKLRRQGDLHYQIEVDGGINIETFHKIHQCDIAVVGSYITNEEDYEKQIRNLK